MSAINADGASDPDFPLAGQARSLVHMPVQGEQRLSLLDKPLDRNAADVDIQRNVLISLPIQRRAI